MKIKKVTILETGKSKRCDTLAKAIEHLRENGIVARSETIVDHFGFHKRRGVILNSYTDQYKRFTIVKG
ncbi:MAG: hypothetical protein KQ78_02122 [Candidatus Izimaplasma bacterium HR2]|nr:MAG: hypothetical protein KQ78_02122 [Candidatus Izimaplasma bacterium HR2]